MCGHGGIKAVSAWVVLCKISLLSLWSSNFLPRDYATLREALTRATGLDFTAHRTLTYLYKSLGQGSHLTETNICFQSAQFISVNGLSLLLAPLQEADTPELGQERGMPGPQLSPLPQPQVKRSCSCQTSISPIRIMLGAPCCRDSLDHLHVHLCASR